MFKYQDDNKKYVKFILSIHQTELFNIGLSVEKSI